MQIEFDVEVLMETIQNAALRRRHFVAYVPLRKTWCVTSPNGLIRGERAQLEKIFDVLDTLPIVQEVPDADTKT